MCTWGTAILIKRHLVDKVIEVSKDTDGRFVIIVIECDRTKYTLINIYAPTQLNENEQIMFLHTLRDELVLHEYENIILGGDFNIVLNPCPDKKGGNININRNARYRKELITFIETLSLCDVWRNRNADKFNFTWHCKKTKIFCRLDFWLIGEQLINNVMKTSILPTINSDHKLIHISLKTSYQKRGPSYWKFNTSLLKDKEYVDMMENVINASIRNHMHDNKNLMWELIKMEIRSATISFCKYKKVTSNKYVSDLNSKLKTLHDQICNTNASDDIIEEMLAIENELKMIENEKINGMIMRSKVKWAEDGEKSSPFFLGLEKNNYINKHITQLNIDGNIITEPSLILENEKLFYEALYHEKNNNSMDDINSLLRNLNIPKLNLEKVHECELRIEINECKTILNVLKNGKTPGIDGLPPEFYKFFWNSINEHLINAMNYTFETGEMSSSQRLGIITLIPKKDKDRLFLKNWRPISLLTTDYKLLTKLLATKLSKVLPSIISPDQTAYLKGRYIGENIRTVADIIEYCKSRNVTSVLLLIDFEKAFDTVKWEFLYRILKKFNFGKRFLTWVKILYTNITSTVLNNGYFSKYFQLYRGVRQGCPISAYLFLPIVEVLAYND
jgi:hypothetical protein